MFGRISKNTAGFTLIEMMVAIALGMIVIAGATGTFTAQTRQNAAEEQISQMHQNVRGALDMIIRDLMQAGYKKSGGSVTGVTYVSTTQILIQADLDENGAIDSTSTTTLEYITYAYDSTNRRITRQLGTGGSAEVLAEDITQCDFAYSNANGASTTTSTTIRKVNITITGRTAKVDPSYSTNSGYRTYSVSADVTPPNLAL